MRTVPVTQSEFHIPSVVTKQLKFNEVNGRQKVRISSNFLPLMGFNKDDRIVAVPSMDGGFNVRKSDAGPLKVYSRLYKRARQNNPLEALVEFANSSLIKQSFPPGTERYHVQMRQGELKVRPIPNRVFNIRKRFIDKDPHRALVAMTGGVDIHALANAGFKTDVVVEYRPEEARDRTQGRNLSEVHALNTLKNGAPTIVVNEDLYQLDPHRLKAMCDEGDPIALGHYSLVCDDHSLAKSPSLRDRSVQDLSTGVDMVYPALRSMEIMGYPVIMVENVRGFQESQAGIILQTMLRRFGYNVSPLTFNARDYGGHQNRVRHYMIASIFPGFEAPKPKARNESSIWPIIERRLHECRDVTGSKTIQNRGEGRGVPPFLNRNSTFCPTFLKSQDRGIRDGIYIEHEGRILAPSEGLIKDLMSIPEDFDVSWMAKEQSIETLGQSIDYALHHEVLMAVHAHIEQNLGKGPVVRHHHQAGLGF